MSDPVLELEGIDAGFGASQILFGINLAVSEGEIAGVLGLNGAGKSVTMKVIAGLIPAWKGAVRLNGRDIGGLAPEQRVALGLGHVPQGRQVFPELTVEENLRLGAYTLRRRDKSRYAPSLTGTWERFPKLHERRRQAAGTMSGGEQAALAVARALINEPTVVLVDEPSAGLAPLIVRDVFATLKEVATTGVTMVLVEQNVAAALQLVDTVTLLQTGTVAWHGSVADLDRSMLATRLGIGRMLGPSVKKAAPRKKAAVKKAAPKKAAAKKSPATGRTTSRKPAPSAPSSVKKKAVAKKVPAKKAVRKKP